MKYLRSKPKKEMGWQKCFANYQRTLWISIRLDRTWEMKKKQRYTSTIVLQRIKYCLWICVRFVCLPLPLPLPVVAEYTRLNWCPFSRETKQQKKATKSTKSFTNNILMCLCIKSLLNLQRHRHTEWVMR